MQKINIKLSEKQDSPNGEVSFLTFHIKWNFEFKNGQFVMLESENLKGIKRAYSIANTNQDCQNNKKICFYVKKASENGMSDYLTQKIQIGEQIEMIWPFGFYVDKQDIKNYLFLSVWAGIAANIPIYENLIQNDKKFEKVVNIFGERNVDKIPQILFDKISKQSKNVKNMIYLSKQDVKKDWFYNWYAQSWIDEALSFLWTKNIKVFICGKPEMVDDAVEKLVNRWVNKQNILYEKY